MSAEVPVVSETTSKSRNYCCVYGCSSIRMKTIGVMYHKFPKEGEQVEFVDDFGVSQICDRKKLWEHRLLMGKKVTKYMYVCSQHFQKSDYIQSGWSSKKTLKNSSVPSQNLPKRPKIYKMSSSPSKDISTRQQRLTQRNLEKEKISSLSQKTLEAAETLLNLNSTIEETPPNAIFPTTCDAAVQMDVKEYRDIGVQVDNQDILTIADFVTNDKQLNTLTGIRSFVLLNTLVHLLSTMWGDKRIHRLSPRKRVFLSFMKLKLDLPYTVLSVLFSVSSVTCKTVFFETITYLSSILKSVIIFPEADEIKRNLPKCFKDFQKVRVVLDCTEIPVQKHKNLCCRIKTYSHYKGTTTIKFMTGVSPAGLITHVSPPYGGRVSDKAIFERSGILDQLRMHRDEIMVDKGFLIEDYCATFAIRIVRPPFLRKNKQLSRCEAVQNAKIASARVHIERTNQRIKVFKILCNRLPVKLIPIVDDIFTVICAIVNLSTPILADDKFLGCASQPQ